MISVGLWLIQLYGYGDKVEAFREAYAQWGAWIILLKGLTPDPLQDRHHHVRALPVTTSGYSPFFDHYARRAVLSFWRFCCTATARARVTLLKNGWAYGCLLGAVVIVIGIVAALYLF